MGNPARLGSRHGHPSTSTTTARSETSLNLLPNHTEIIICHESWVEREQEEPQQKVRRPMDLDYTMTLRIPLHSLIYPGPAQLGSNNMAEPSGEHHACFFTGTSKQARYLMFKQDTSVSLRTAYSAQRQPPVPALQVQTQDGSGEKSNEVKVGLGQVKSSQARSDQIGSDSTRLKSTRQTRRSTLQCCPKLCSLSLSVAQPCLADSSAHKLPSSP